MLAVIIARSLASDSLAAVKCAAAGRHLAACAARGLADEALGALHRRRGDAGPDR